MHHIQKHILKELTVHQTRRYSDMRPQNVDSNLYSYHLKSLIRDQFVVKTEKAYGLTPKGLAYVERVSIDKFEPRLQPKVIMIFVVENDKEEILLWLKSKQPFINTWSLLSGKMHLDDESLTAAIERELIEKFDLLPQGIRHLGDCYIRAYVENELVSCVTGHICKLNLPDSARLHDRTRWVKKSELSLLDTSPATEQIFQDTQIEQPFFFKEYEVHRQSR